ncbi:MAG: thermonuclease family protein, partial [Proteobacteria bacterium]|nr:thermonuclease family protein [Pseudomonadota bacterium]
MKLAFALVALAIAGPAQALTGIVTHVSDGDTVWVKRDDAPRRKPVKLRLAGIDAPERCQPWGAEASAALT